MTDFNWTITTTRFTLAPDRTPETIFQIYWTCQAVENSLRAVRSGVTGANLPADTPEADIILYVQDRNPAIEPALQEQIDAQNVPTISSGRPWEEQFPVWAAGIAYAIDDMVQYNGVAYRAIQAHTSESGWTPPAVPALWVSAQDPGNPDQVWIAGEQVAVNDLRWWPAVDTQRWICLQQHTTQDGWEPPNVPSLWREVV